MKLERSSLLILLKKSYECFDYAQHERKISNDLKIPLFVLSAVEGLPQSF